ncbi:MULTISPECIES: hypothetical protein [unclassified Streptomyces]|uniref:hypothetical protein n=1 Tax=unclassified Streptomyces TaxID=2593676 RepID=UPI003D8B6294
MYLYGAAAAETASQACAEERELFRVRRPSSAQVGLFGLTLLEAADHAKIIPDGRGTGYMIAMTAIVGLAKACIRRKR